MSSIMNKLHACLKTVLYITSLLISMLKDSSSYVAGLWFGLFEGKCKHNLASLFLFHDKKVGFFPVYTCSIRPGCSPKEIDTYFPQFYMHISF